MFWVGFIVGMLIGGFFGIIISAFLRASKDDRCE